MTEIITAHNPNYVLVAKVTKKEYAVRVFNPEESTFLWKTSPITEKSNSPEVAEECNYTPPRNYVPHHWKNFKRACKLLIQKHWQDYGKLPYVTPAAGLKQTSNYDHKNAKNLFNRRGKGG